MIFALLTMVYGALLKLAQSDAKRFYACSTISRISYSVFGIASMTACGVQGGMFYFLSHILGKAILFSTAGILVYQCDGHLPQAVSNIARLGCRNLLELSFLLTLLIKYK